MILNVYDFGIQNSKTSESAKHVTYQFNSDYLYTEKNKQELTLWPRVSGLLCIHLSKGVRRVNWKQLREPL